MGRIAAIGSPQALSLFRDVIAASASIPVIFAPILIDAAANGHHFQEMHADGGVMEPVLTLPEAFLLRDGALARGLRMNIYILINNTVERDFELVPNSTIDIAARASASVTKTQTRSILYQTFDFARRNNLGFNLTYIDKSVHSPGLTGFETSYMRALYGYGYDKAKGGSFWVRAPPSDDLFPSGVPNFRNVAVKLTCRTRTERHGPRRGPRERVIGSARRTNAAGFVRLLMSIPEFYSRENAVNTRFSFRPLSIACVHKRVLWPPGLKQCWKGMPE
jgi:hypothetical protein